MAALFLPGCAPSIPHEAVPPGWTLDVHRPGEWWTQPLIPRSVVVQRCPPKPGWRSEPDLSTVTALPPGIDVNYSLLGDDYHCLIGWSQPTGDAQLASGELDTEAGLRRACSSSGLPMDAGWRYLGHKVTDQLSDLPNPEEVGVASWENATAAFIDEHRTVVSCLVQRIDGPGVVASVELSVGADLSASAKRACPVQIRDVARSDDGTLLEYQLRGAGAVRGTGGRVLTDAATLRIGLAGDPVTTSYPVVDGVAIVQAATMRPKVAIPFEWDRIPPVEGAVYDGDGRLLATCGG